MRKLAWPCAILFAVILAALSIPYGPIVTIPLILIEVAILAGIASRKRPAA